MLIKVKTLTGKEVSFDIEPDNNIKDIKEKVSKLEGIPVEQQRLIFAGKQLKDDSMLSHYKIEPGSVLHMILSLRGG